MRSVFAASRRSVDRNSYFGRYLAFVLLLAAILSDDGTVATRRAWITRLFFLKEQPDSSSYVPPSFDRLRLRGGCIWNTGFSG